MASSTSSTWSNNSSLPNTPEEWKKWKDERKASKRKWKEKKLITTLEKKKQMELESKREAAMSSRTEETWQHPTVSIAIPGSILDNAQTPELRTYLAGQIARAAVIFNVDEIVIFDESGLNTTTTEGDYQGIRRKGQANVQMARILQYLECPQYLRKNFFPQHKDLQYAGLLNPLDCPHHVKAHEESPFREGVVLDKPVKESKGSFVHVGLSREIQIDKKLQPGVRVTVKLQPGYLEKLASKKKVHGQVVSPSEPANSGLYWGYSVRLADSLAAVFTGSPHSDGYDMLIGTSERGSNINEFEMGEFKNLLLVFGGVKGLEYSLDADQNLHVSDPQFLFNHYLNLCPNQGSNTIRTEEALLIGLSALMVKNVKHMERKGPGINQNPGSSNSGNKMSQ